METHDLKSPAPEPQAEAQEVSPLELLGIPPLGFFLTLALGLSAGLVAYLP